MIFTFYSYKGGVGRSMALANVGYWLYLQGLRVVMVDWDLEAPGLENFFYDAADDLERVRSQPGVIDLLTAYKREFSHLRIDAAKPGHEQLSTFLKEHLPSLRDFLHQIKPRGSLATRPDATLSLLPAGWRSRDRFSAYAENVQSFDWVDFYERFRGKEYLDWFRRTLDDEAFCDAVLIDSRTGVTEMGGVCTRELADVVVACCAPNAGNLAGTVTIAQSFRREGLLRARDLRPIETLIVPTRIENTELERKNTFRMQFDAAVEEFTPQVLRENHRTFWSLQIPYVPHYAYRETLVVGIAGSDEHLETAYKNLTAHMAVLAPAGSRLRKHCEPELLRLLSWDKVVTGAAAVSEEQASALGAQEVNRVFETLSKEDQAAARRLLTRLVRVEAAVGSDSLRPIRRKDVPRQVESVLTRFLDASLIVSSGESDGPLQVIQAAGQLRLLHWRPLRQWIDEDREFLLWRQHLEGSVDEWRRTGEDAGTLLRGASLNEALKNLGERPLEFTDQERRFIDASQAGEAQAAAEKQERDLREQELARLTAARRRMRLVLGAAVLVVGISLLGWVLWTRSEPYQMRQVFRQGEELAAGLAARGRMTSEVKKISVAASLAEWCKALILSGNGDRAVTDVRQLENVRERTEGLARVALWSTRARMEDASKRAAAEAVTAEAALPIQDISAVPVIAHDLVAAGRHQSAIAMARHAKTASRQVHNTLDRALLLADLATAFSRANSNTDAASTAQDAVDVALKIDDPRDRASVLADIASQLADAQQPESARRAANEAVHLIQPSSPARIPQMDLAAKVLIMARAGQALNMVGDMTPAGHILDAAQASVTSVIPPADRRRVMVELAELLAATQLTETAREVALDARDEALKIAAEEAEVQASELRRVVDVLVQADSPREAMSAAGQINDPAARAFVFARLAASLPDTNKAEAVHAADLAREFADNIEDAHSRVDVLSQVAEVFLKGDRVDAASEAARKGLEIAQRIRQSANLFFDRARLASVLARVGREEDARVALDILRSQAEALEKPEDFKSLGMEADEYSKTVARTAQELAALRQFKRARELAARAQDPDRLEALARIVFEYSRTANPSLADALEQSAKHVEK